MYITCWTRKVTYKLSQYVVFLVFPKQQWLHERVSMLRYKYIVSLVYQAIVPSFIENRKLSTITTIRRLTISFTAICPYLYHIRGLLEKYPTFFLCKHLMDYNLARLHEPTLNLNAHA